MIAGIIVFGFVITGFINYYTYSKIIKENIKNISKLTSTNIYSEINNEIIKPIFVSLTMANDSFLMDWLNGEDHNDKNELLNYLSGIKKKYNYDSVFLVSEQSKNYYHYDGIFKKLSKDDAHDIWYYDFLNSKDSYKLDVDQDEVDHHQLTVFINCKIYNKEGNFLGVTGVGIKMGKIQEMLKFYETNFNLEAFLIDENGLIQAHTNKDFIEKVNMFDEEIFQRLQPKIIHRKTELLSFLIHNNGVDGYLITRYIPEFNWYLIIKKDTSVLSRTFYKQWIDGSIIIILVIFIILLIVLGLIRKNEKQLLNIAQTDQLTGILNRRAFDHYLDKAISTSKQTISPFSIVIFDIDHFKRINDTYGHVFGDNIIKRITHIISNHLSLPNIIARWGGDEFAGIIFGDEATTLALIKRIQDSMHTDEELCKHHITLSIGTTSYAKDDTTLEILRRVDYALYQAKENGRDCIEIL